MSEKKVVKRVLTPQQQKALAEVEAKAIKKEKAIKTHKKSPKKRVVKKKASPAKPKAKTPEKVKTPVKVASPKKTSPKKVKVARKKPVRSEGITRSFARRVIVRHMNIEDGGIRGSALTFIIQEAEIKLADILKRTINVAKIAQRKTATAKLILGAIDPCHKSLRTAVLSAEPRRDLPKKDRKYVLPSIVAKRLFEAEHASMRLSSSGKAAIAGIVGYFLAHIAECAGRYTKVAKRSRISMEDVTAAIQSMKL